MRRLVLGTNATWISRGARGLGSIDVVLDWLRNRCCVRHIEVTTPAIFLSKIGSEDFARALHAR